MDGKIDDKQLILMCLQLILKSGVCPETKPYEWVKTLLYMHMKGYLYVGYEKEHLSVVVGAYRIKEFNEKVTQEIPEEEEGNILYIPFLASFAEDKNIPLRMLRNYLDKNKDIKEVVFYERNSDDDLRRYIRKGADDVKEENSDATASADVSREPVCK